MIIALLGAESSGKSTLAAALHRRLLAAWATVPGAQALPRLTHVPEYLRHWSLQHGRNPRQHEQAHMATTQAQRITAALGLGGGHDWVIADTTPWMTAVYSEHYFGDTSLYATAQPFHCAAAAVALQPLALPPLTLLMGLDLPWVADGALRDGPATQHAIDNLLRQQLDRWQCPYQTLYGSGPARVAAALHAVACHLGHQADSHYPVSIWQQAIQNEANNAMNESAGGIKKHENMPPSRATPYAATCDGCDDTAAERRTFSRLLAGRPTTHAPAPS